MSDKYVAYVGTYTQGTSHGIHVYDIEKGVLKEKQVQEINNPSNITISKDGKFLYSICDEGVAAFHILPDGQLSYINTAWIGGMRGCYVKVDDTNTLLFVGGFHDGKVTAMWINKDGSIGEIADSVYHKGLGNSFSERGSAPHVVCTQITPDSQYLCVADSGLSQIKIYSINYETGKLSLADILRFKLESGPRRIRFSKDGKFAYVLLQEDNMMVTFKYVGPEHDEMFEKIDEFSTVLEKYGRCNSCEFKMSEDDKHIFVAIDGYNAVAIYERNAKTGLLTFVCCSQVSGDYPKVVSPLPDGKHFVSLNHDSNQIMTFSVNYKDKYVLMSGAPIKIDQPNCILMNKMEG